MATPRTARTTDMVSTSAPAMSTTLLETSAQANEEAPSKAGPICARRLPACGVESLFTIGMCYAGRRCQSSQPERNVDEIGAVRKAHHLRFTRILDVAGPRSR